MFRIAKVCIFLFVVWVTLMPGLEIQSNRYLPFFNLQADAFIHGKADIDVPQGWWAQDSIIHDGKAYFSLPPLNGFLLVPFVAVFGHDFPERVFTLLLALAYFLVILKYLKAHVRSETPYDEILWCLFFMAGTGILTCTAIGTAWFSAALCSSLFLSLSGLYLLKKPSVKNHFLSLLFLAIASMGRFHLALLFPVFLTMLWLKHYQKKWKKFLILMIPSILFGGFVLVWNEVRFGELFDLYYREHQKSAHLQEMFNQYGTNSIRYVFLHLYHGLFGMPKLVPTFPFFSYDDDGNGLFALSPLFLFLIFRDRKWKEEDFFALGCTALVAIPILTLFSTGWRQFGYRYALDVFPFLIFLLTRSRFRITSPLALVLIAVSLWFNILGTLGYNGMFPNPQ